MKTKDRPRRMTPLAIAAMAALLALGLDARAQEPAPEAALPEAAVPGAEDAKVAGQDVPVPSRKKYVAPQYPAAAAAEGIRGIVIVRLTIGEDGRVLDVRVTRSIPGLDEAAMAAVRLWEYEATEVEGKPVKVLLSQSITFALRLPDLRREAGVPELRSGGAPPVPPSLATPESASVTVTLGSEGEVLEAAIIEGNSVVGEALLRAVKSWRFLVSATASRPSFTIRGEWSPGPRPSLALRAFDYSAGERRAGSVRPDDPGLNPTSADGAEPPPDPSPDASLDVETEVLPARPEPPAREEGVSSVPDVLLGENIPDLTRGRRPVWPPLARLGSITGDVVVNFSVDLAGRTTVHSTEGDEMLKDSAEQAVGTWLFRRTAIDRVNLIATFKFSADRAVALVERVP